MTISTSTWRPLWPTLVITHTHALLLSILCPSSAASQVLIIIEITAKCDRSDYSLATWESCSSWLNECPSNEQFKYDWLKQGPTGHRQEWTVVSTRQMDSGHWSSKALHGQHWWRRYMEGCQNSLLVNKNTWTVVTKGNGQWWLYTVVCDSAILVRSVY